MSRLPTVERPLRPMLGVMRPEVWAFPATGATWSILSRAPLPRRARRSVMALVEGFEGVWSRFRADSLISRAADGRLGSGPIRLELPEGSGAMLDLYDRLHVATGGRIDPLVGADLVALGYDPACTFTVHAGSMTGPGPRARGRWGALARHEGDALILDRPALVDVGAIGKGFLADLVGALLLESGVEDFVIDASGDVLVHADGPVRIGLEDPAVSTDGADSARAVGVVEIARGAVAGSGISRRAWGDGLHHILDGLTGRPSARVTAAWAIAETCALADGLSTALFLTAPGELAASGLRFECAILSADGSAEVSRGLPGSLFTA
ncbi:FAD:protein FMN transferase [Actinomyces gaoshouyii]|uniref:FAD:protein FMN transferase n=1 Tax=Actinomyces gaoshouyii TaxID=1960083 RepID=A0A8H9HBY8_9ACTO|nr:FAD:protein FMN transferase [Actinomyces gaoshouyii]GGO99218.1 FAD:protein FMN transferase [Actinomyces gaoshouyii]